MSGKGKIADRWEKDVYNKVKIKTYLVTLLNVSMAELSANLLLPFMALPASQPNP